MKVRCEYCGSFIDDSEGICPHCGAAINIAPQTAGGVPRTIEELRNYCIKRNYPLSEMRFFIGEDYRGARAFGIYKDSNGDFVVYKNKADGTRAVRYSGSDEAYAVNEIYQKMKEEVLSQKERNARMRASGNRGVPEGVGYDSTRKATKNRSPIFIIIVFALVAYLIITTINSRSVRQGYYSYNDGYYYNFHNTWYQFDDVYNTWEEVTVEPELQDNYGNYFSSTVPMGEEYDFTDSDFYYESYDDDDDDWDSGWDSGDSWDSGSTDWDSDW